MYKVDVRQEDRFGQIAIGQHKYNSYKDALSIYEILKDFFGEDGWISINIMTVNEKGEIEDANKQKES